MSWTSVGKLYHLNASLKEVNEVYFLKQVFEIKYICHLLRYLSEGSFGDYILFVEL